ncbi:MAG TPA: ABC transporter permease, partial [Pyrinomonadaceae bacterium]
MTFIDIRESALMAFDTVRSNKLRSALTILGVSVGVITVVFMVSIIQGLNKAFAAQIESLGSNTIWATKFDPSIGHQPTSEEIHRKELTIADADAIRREAPSVVGVSPFYRKINETVRYGDKQSDTPILIGVTPYHEFTVSSYVARGRYITDLDVEARNNICVLGLDLVK